MRWERGIPLEHLHLSDYKVSHPRILNVTTDETRLVSLSSILPYMKYMHLVTATKTSITLTPTSYMYTLFNKNKEA
jgi:hypothetical protein